eukprot:gb/GFBE01071176.1/.p1 GENE.gb/GFBE01071176.1/~~gb/GFBE01071176.1/.p1  ORF type:complete len:765 (+),score=153.79 gb/GFBE01071176.1/:1-2295(+)
MALRLLTFFCSFVACRGLWSLESAAGFAVQENVEQQCHDSDPKLDDKSLTHVMYTSDLNQVAGMMASVVSLIDSSSDASKLVVHIVIRPKLVPEFRCHFGVRPGCNTTLAEGGALVHLQVMPPEVMELSEPASPHLAQDRLGGVPETYARAYIHKIFPDGVVLYLDADVIVQKDVHRLRRNFADSGKTIGFIERSPRVNLSFYVFPDAVPVENRPDVAPLKRLLNMTEYNTGVVIINTGRWAAENRLDMFTRWLRVNKLNDYTLFSGHDQTALNLVFLNDEEQAYVVYDSIWNLEVDHQPEFDIDQLRQAAILHFNGNRKPWLGDRPGLELWKRHWDRFNSTFCYHSGVCGRCCAGAPVPHKHAESQSKPVEAMELPALLLVLGAIFVNFSQTRVFGKLTLFFGAKAAMNLYIKFVLSASVVSEERNLKGFPAAFAITGIQQLVAFFLFLSMQLTPYKYTPKKLEGWKDMAALSVFAFTFAAMLALNNFSLELAPLSVNLIIKACSPVPTLILQEALRRFTNDGPSEAQPLGVVLMLIGVLFAIMTILADLRPSSNADEQREQKMMSIGVFVSTLSLLTGSANHVVAGGMLGRKVKLNLLDLVFYMSVPVFLLLLPLVFFVRHPVAWLDADGGALRMTDWEVILEVARLSPSTVMLAFLSGPLALAYNMLQYHLIQSLSATFVAYTGNMSSAFTVVLSMLFGMESLPRDWRGVVVVVGCLGNIGAFAGFAAVRAKASSSATTASQVRAVEGVELGEMRATTSRA